MGWQNDITFMEHFNNSLEFKKLGKIKQEICINSDECCICYEKLENSSRYALIPCGHTQYCEACIDKLPNNTCGICKLRYTSKFKIFM